MPNDTTLRLRYPTGATLYTQIEAPDGTFWNGSAYAAFSVGSWGTFAVASPETPASSGRYACQFPTSSAAGNYTWATYLQAGGSPASTDVCVGTGSGSWDGNTFGLGDQVIATNATLAGYNTLLDSGVVTDSSPTATSFLGSPNLSADSNVYRTLSVCFTDGDLQSAKSVITAYNGTTKRFTVSGFSKAPANGDAFKLI